MDKKFRDLGNIYILGIIINHSDGLVLQFNKTPVCKKSFSYLSSGDIIKFMNDNKIYFGKSVKFYNAANLNSEKTGRAIKINMSEVFIEANLAPEFVEIDYIKIKNKIPKPPTFSEFPKRSKSPKSPKLNEWVESQISLANNIWKELLDYKNMPEKQLNSLLNEEFPEFCKSHTVCMHHMIRFEYNENAFRKYLERSVEESKKITHENKKSEWLKRQADYDQYLYAALNKTTQTSRKKRYAETLKKLEENSADFTSFQDVADHIAEQINAKQSLENRAELDFQIEQLKSLPDLETIHANIPQSNFDLLIKNPDQKKEFTLPEFPETASGTFFG